MKAEEVSAIAGVGAGLGVFGARYVEKTVPFLSNKWLNAGVGAVLGAVGWLMDMDGVGDFVEGFGIGYLLSALL